jgi:hypothetical protein
MAELEREIARAQSVTAESVLDRLLETNPVDTGWSRANWIPTVGEPDLEPRLPRGNPASTAIGQGVAEIMQHLDPHLDLHLSNQVPYIEPLNHGHSSQASAGYVERAAEEGQDVAQGKVDARTVRL